MQLDWRIRLALVIGGVVVVAVALAGAAWGSLDGPLVHEALTVVGGILAGLGLAGGPSRGAGAALLILALSAPLAACASWQEPGPAGACETETAVVDGLEAARGAVAPLIPADVIVDLDHSLEAGRALVATCEAARDRAAWQGWVGPALSLAQSIAGIISHHAGSKSKGVASAPSVPSLDRAILLLEAEACQ